MANPTLQEMLGSRDVKKMIYKEFESAYDNQIRYPDKLNPDKIHASEASRCTRLAYYERKNPLPPDSNSTISVLIKDSIRRLLVILTLNTKLMPYQYWPLPIWLWMENT